jgi:hypothetical protein
MEADEKKLTELKGQPETNYNGGTKLKKRRGIDVKR